MLALLGSMQGQLGAIVHLLLQLLWFLLALKSLHLGRRV